LKKHVREEWKREEDEEKERKAKKKTGEKIKLH